MTNGFTDTGEDARNSFAAMGLDWPIGAEGAFPSRSPIDGAELGRFDDAAPQSIDRTLADATTAFAAWRAFPAPKRGELVRLLGEELRAAKEPLGRLVTLDAGKIISEGLGEVQEMIDICDFAVGLSRQIGGLTLPSERPDHRMMETWHSLGPCLVISSFNFPVAVWSWNTAISLVCGNPVIWKPSEKTPLTALAVQGLFDRAAARFADLPEEIAAGLSSVVLGGPDSAKAMIDDPRVKLVSATGSCRMGRTVGAQTAGRFKRTILELGGNNAAIVAPSADMDLALRAVAFSALGTAGQRCTSLRRLFLHKDIYSTFLPRLASAFESVAIGDPRDSKTLVGPLIDPTAADAMEAALSAAKNLGANTIGGGGANGVDGGVYVRPAIVEMTKQAGPMLEETFAPILYVTPYTELNEAIALQNEAAQGLSSSIFTTDIREAEIFLSSVGSDCGIANVNIGTSGAEIGGAFGGEKETGGGRESGSDAWKAYMRRATNTINYGSDLPLAQGVSFEV